MPISRMRRYVAIVAALPIATVIASARPAAAEVITFKLLTNYSQASFRSDAPLETFVGTSALEGIQGNLAVDPDKPDGAKGSVRVDMDRVTTGIAKRDADMRSKSYLDTEVEANRWVTFEMQRVEVAGPLVPGKETPARVHGLLTIKQKVVPKVVDATVTYIKLTPEQVEAQKRFGFTSDNLKVKAKLTATFTEHGLQVPQLLFLKVANELQLATDLVFVRAQ
jgi:polyisoprenoid-binding protein YceI